MTPPALAYLQLSPEEAGAVRLLHRLQARHPGLRILTPAWPNEPWRADIGEGTVPGDDREMIVTAYQPSELLAKLEGMFAPPEDDSG